MRTTGDLTLKLFGKPRSLLHGERPALPSKGFQLLSYLTFQDGHRIRRQAAAALLWEDIDTTRSMSNLRQLLARIRRHSGAENDLIGATDEEIYLTPMSMQSDLFHLLSVSEETDLDTLIEVLCSISGSLMETEDPETEELSLWLEINRSKLQTRIFDLFEKCFTELSRFGIAKKQVCRSLADKLLALELDDERAFQMVYDTYHRLDMIEEALEIRKIALKKIGLELKNRTSSRFTIRNHTVEKEEAQASAPIVAFTNPQILLLDSQSASLLRMFVEDVANRLARFRTFQVMAPYSSFLVQRENVEQQDNIQTAIDYRVESYVTPDGNRMPFSLIESKTNTIIWSAEYDVSNDALCQSFGLIATHVANALADGVENHRIFGLHATKIPEAYFKALQGSMLLRNCTLPTLRRARKEFQKAALLDPKWASPRAKIAQTLQMEWLVLGGTDAELLNNAKNQAETSIEIDPYEASGHWVRAVIAMYQRDIETCRLKFAEAESLSPSSADLLVEYADALCHFGNPEEAIVQYRAAIKLNPNPPDSYLWVEAGISFAVGDYAKAVNICENMDNIDPALRIMTASLELSGDHVRSREYAKILREHFPNVSAKDHVKLIPDENRSVVDRLVKALTAAGL